MGYRYGVTQMERDDMGFGREQERREREKRDKVAGTPPLFSEIYFFKFDLHKLHFLKSTKNLLPVKDKLCRW